jgi:magnesium transporter
VHLHSRHSRPLASVKNHGGAQLVAAESAHLVDRLVADGQMLAVESLTVLAMIDACGNLMNNSMNNLLRKLTLINVVFLPLNLIASIGGMSEFSMMTAAVPWWIAYPLFLAAMLVAGGLMVIVLKRLTRGSPSVSGPPTEPFMFCTGCAANSDKTALPSVLLIKEPFKEQNDSQHPFQ